MKYIPLHTTEKFNTRAVIEAVAGQPQEGIPYEEIRRRLRIIDALEKAPSTHLLLEDADHAHLTQLAKGFKFGVVHKDLLAIIDDILEAKAPPAVVVPSSTAA